MEEHVILVAVTVEANTRREAEHALYEKLPTPGQGGVESWWIAEDDRMDGSDCDSAIFVTRGFQPKAAELTRRSGMSSIWSNR